MSLCSADRLLQSPSACAVLVQHISETITLMTCCPVPAPEEDILLALHVMVRLIPVTSTPVLVKLLAVSGHRHRVRAVLVDLLARSGDAPALCDQLTVSLEMHVHRGQWDVVDGLSAGMSRVTGQLGRGQLLGLAKTMSSALIAVLQQSKPVLLTLHNLLQLITRVSAALGEQSPGHDRMIVSLRLWAWLLLFHLQHPADLQVDMEELAQVTSPVALGKHLILDELFPEQLLLDKPLQLIHGFAAFPTAGLPCAAVLYYAIVQVMESMRIAATLDIRKTACYALDLQYGKPAQRQAISSPCFSVLPLTCFRRALLAIMSRMKDLWLLAIAGYFAEDSAGVEHCGQLQHLSRDAVKALLAEQAVYFIQRYPPIPSASVS